MQGVLRRRRRRTPQREFQPVVAAAARPSDARRPPTLKLSAPDRPRSPCRPRCRPRRWPSSRRAGRVPSGAGRDSASRHGMGLAQGRWPAVDIGGLPRRRLERRAGARTLFMFEHDVDRMGLPTRLVCDVSPADEGNDPLRVPSPPSARLPFAPGFRPQALRASRVKSYFRATTSAVSFMLHQTAGIFLAARPRSNLPRPTTVCMISAALSKADPPSVPSQVPAP
jgi:hypothetical protein